MKTAGDVVEALARLLLPEAPLYRRMSGTTPQDHPLL